MGVGWDRSSARRLTACSRTIWHTRGHTHHFRKCGIWSFSYTATMRTLWKRWSTSRVAFFGRSRESFRLIAMLPVPDALADHHEDDLAAPAVTGQVVEPFFTTKQEGLGMGLAISRSIGRAHEGRIWGENDPAGGAIFRVRLPTERGAAVKAVSDR